MEQFAIRVDDAQDPCDDRFLAELRHPPLPKLVPDPRPPSPTRIIGQSALWRELLEQLRTVASTNATVLVHGETGTGKELVARAIHELGQRPNGPFVSLNSAAIPAQTLESELFGHERGAFTGAIARRYGRFEAAQDGTLFLDEIGELARDLQPKLLRVLQDGSFERLGSGTLLYSNARLVTATNRDLQAMAKTGAFRSDLYYRLSVFPIRVPPLRERREDIPVLAQHFLLQFAHKMNKNVRHIVPSALSKLVAHDWPGNIRQLQNVIERAVILATGPEVDVSPPAPRSFARASVDQTRSNRRHASARLTRDTMSKSSADGLGVVAIVDDDESVRNSLRRLFQSIGYLVETYASSAAYLAADRSEDAGCLVLDVQLPGASGLELQRQLSDASRVTPIVFLTGHGDIPMSVRAMKAGAAEFLTKPFLEHELLKAVRDAVDRDRALRLEQLELATIRKRYESLTARERAVMAGIAEGLLSKQIAARFGTSEVTVKEQRARVMTKMRVESVAELVRAALRLAIEIGGTPPNAG